MTHLTEGEPMTKVTPLTSMTPITKEEIEAMTKVTALTCMRGDMKNNIKKEVMTNMTGTTEMVDITRGEERGGVTLVMIIKRIRKAARKMLNPGSL